jgi:serine/threonine protein kinase
MSEVIGKFRLLQHLGSGFFGDVWRAEGAEGKRYAIKIVKCNWPSGKGPAIESGLKHLSRLAAIRHPSLLTLERLEIIDDQLVLVMEFAEKSLGDRFRECRQNGLPGVPAEELRQYLADAALIIDQLITQHQIPHWDLKPQNLLIVGNKVKVCDFGQVADLQVVKSGYKGGSNPIYSAPEIFDGTPTAFSDQYSLAVIYQEMLTGERPYIAGTLYQLMTQHLHAQPSASNLPEKDQPAIRRAMSKKPEIRFTSCLEFVRALSPVEKVEPALPTPVPVVSSTRGGTVPGAPSKPSKPDAPSGRPVKPLPSVPQVEEIPGEGVLVPALVIGLGRSAVPVLQQTRAALMDRFGSPEKLPHIRWLYIDIDPAGIAAAHEGTRGIALSAQEVLLTRLSTTDHYEKGVRLRVPIASWLDPIMLYRIPRTLLTGGVRALGRLALMDHYSEIIKKLRDDLSACSQLATLAEAAKRTGLIMRSNRPRVFLLTQLAGGTGSGMYIDLAYIVRDILRQMGHPPDQIDALLMLPADESRSEKPAYLANTYAALNELKHFSRPGSQFQADHGDPEGILSDDGSPFRQCWFLPAEPEDGKNSMCRTTELASGCIFANLITPLGRIADTCRNKAAKVNSMATNETSTHRSPRTTRSSFGMYRFSWPKRSLIQQAARHICAKLVGGWLAPVTPNAAEVKGWLTEQWNKRRLDPAQILERIEESCEKTWKKKPEDVLSAISAQFMAENAPKLDAAYAENAIVHIEQLAGKPRYKPQSGKSPPPPGAHSVLERTFLDVTRSLSSECEKELAEVCVSGLDNRALRLAGAEVAIPQILNLIDSLERKEGQHREALAETSEVAYDRLQTLAGNLEGLGAFLRRGNTAAELVQFFYLYPKARFQELSHDGVLSVIRAIRNAYGRSSKDIGMCRQRLQEFHRSLATLQPFKESAAGVGPGITILPLGCATVDEAVDKIVAGVPEADLKELDRQIQEKLENQQKSLARICLSSQAPQLLNELEVMMQSLAEKFTAARMTETDAADFFLRQYHEDKEIAKDIVGAFHQAAPSLAKSEFRNPTPKADPLEARSNESKLRDLYALTVPLGLAGERFADHARRAMAGIDLGVAAGTDDILFYREIPNLKLEDLTQLGPRFQQAYQEMSAQQNFTPHSRCDITDW